nr:UDP-N-acetylmuramoyl-L-alanyl-D-glutamate--2,6-diaminopimelate ligase [Propionibacterium sp.]
MTETPLRPHHHPGLALAEVVPGASGRLTGICLDSRQVLPGDLYVALPGLRAHGADFVAAAVARGALAVYTDAAGAARAGDPGVPVVVVPDPRAGMGELAARIYGRPARRLTMFGVTGTNGKTSTVFLLEAALAALGRRVATIGTIGFRLGGELVESPRGTVTTPDAPDLQAMLARMAERGADSVAMEVSSHALALHRVDGLTFDVAGFTMFGQDHLDYHATLEDYFAAKARLFTDELARAAVINADDPWGRRLIDRIRSDGGPRLVTVGVDADDVDYRVTAWASRADGSSDVTVRTPVGVLEFPVSMLGDFNVRNALTALAMVGAAGLDVARAASGLVDAQVPGRMQRVHLGAGRPHVVVDFAHTPQAVEAALRALPAGRHVVVLGAGGDRDPLKRGPMGAAAARNADVVVVTDDNPRSEDPAAIRAAVLEGARSAAGAGVRVLDGGDRRAAIHAALDLAGPGEWVAILGKGHETGQTIGDEVIPFDDVQVVRDWAGRH